VSWKEILSALTHHLSPLTPRPPPGDNSPVRLALRVAGWGLFILGMGTFILVGAFQAVRHEDQTHRILAWVGMFGALLGMLLTSTSRLIGHFVGMRKLKADVGRPRKEP